MGYVITYHMSIEIKLDTRKCFRIIYMKYLHIINISVGVKIEVLTLCCAYFFSLEK